MNSVPEIMKAALLSQARCLDYYWPADAEGMNDLAENNLAVHIVHACLEREYAVFAEVDHPDPAVQGVDLLAISADRTHYIAVELKRHISAGMVDSAHDVERLVAFRLNRTLREERCGIEALSVLGLCNSAVGIVAGLKWFGGSRTPQITDDPVAERIRQLGGNSVAKHVHEYPNGSYWLQYGYFPLHFD